MKKYNLAQNLANYLDDIFGILRFDFAVLKLQSQIIYKVFFFLHITNHWKVNIKDKLV